MRRGSVAEGMGLIFNLLHFKSLISLSGSDVLDHRSMLRWAVIGVWLNQPLTFQ
jgi:hypothetical protein